MQVEVLLPTSSSASAKSEQVEVNNLESHQQEVNMPGEIAQRGLPARQQTKKVCFRVFLLLYQSPS